MYATHNSEKSLRKLLQAGISLFTPVAMFQNSFREGLLWDAAILEFRDQPVSPQKKFTKTHHEFPQHSVPT